MRNPLAKTNSPSGEEKLREKKKFKLRDEPDDMLVGTESMEQKRNKMPRVEQQMEL